MNTKAEMKQMTICCSQGDYPVVVGHHLLERLPGLLDELAIDRPRAAVSNTVVGPLYGRQLAAGLGLAEPFELADGEQHKRWPQVETICTWLLGRGLHRSQAVLAVGGGVTTDMVGLAAAVYLRGISWLAVPTTLLAMVDASVGGKTGVNLAQGKNLVGCFWHPRLVVADVAVLATLPLRELRAGLAEVIKTAWIGDQDLLALLDRPVSSYSELTPGQWQELVCRSVAVKAAVVAADERERGHRQVLNLGHTIAHALESATCYERFLHGEAVAWGLLAEAALACRLGLLHSSAAQRLQAAVSCLGTLPAIADIPLVTIVEHLSRDKKRDAKGVAWALPTDTGVAIGQRVEVTDIEEVIENLQGA